VPVATTFMRSFPLEARPAVAALRLRAFRRAALRVNGEPLALPPAISWKDEVVLDVARHLTPGENRVEATVWNDHGPPALSLEIDTRTGVVRSDGTWDASLAGAVWRKARLAREPPGGSRFDPEGRFPGAWEALARTWPRLLAILGAAVAAAAVVHRARQREGAGGAGGAAEWAVLAVLAGAWGALLLHNAPSIPLAAGFDGRAHLDYVRYVLERRALPLAGDGWKMFEAPLYYVVVAALLGVTGAVPGGVPAVAVVRGLGWCLGVLDLALVRAGTRLVLPDRPVSRLAGILVVGSMPFVLILGQYVANEVLAATLGSAILVLAIRMLRDGDLRLGSHVALGLLAGLALLAKSSALVVVVAVGIALLARAVVRPPDRARALGGLAATGVIAMAVGGWHYARVAARYGNPLLGGWDYAWWQDPGFRTLEDLTRFGRVLRQPAYAGFGGVWDGLYSTAWADGLLSGATRVSLVHPWWSPDLASVALALAIVPTLLLLAGLAGLVRDWVRRPAADVGLVLLVALLQGGVLILMAFKVPAAVATKAHYVLPSILVVGVLAARGFAAVTGERALASTVALAALLAWSGTVYASLWIDPGSPAALARQAGDLARRGDVRGALGHLGDACDAEPRYCAALAMELARLGGPLDEVAAVARRAGPSATAQLAEATAAASARDLDRAIGEARRAVEADPDALEARAMLARLLESGGSAAEAGDAWREVLRIDFQDPEAHAALARLLRSEGEAAGAAMHESLARPP
jgi:hypothetical protein